MNKVRASALQKVLVFGGNGLVGSRFVQMFDTKYEIESPDAKAVDILKRADVEKAILQFDPDAVVNFAAYTDVEESEKQKDDKEGICFRINVVGAKNVADVCRKFNKYLIHISTDYVFDGQKQEPYTENDTPNPKNWYGMTKHLGERQVLQSGGSSIIVRISMPYRAKYEEKLDIGRFFLEQLQNGKQISAVLDQTISPTFVDDIARALDAILKNGNAGILHVACKSSTTPYEFAKTVARIFNLDESLVSAVNFSEYNSNKKAKMLKNSALSPLKFDLLYGGILHNLEESVSLFKREVVE